MECRFILTMGVIWLVRNIQTSHTDEHNKFHFIRIHMKSIWAALCCAMLHRVFDTLAHEINMTTFWEEITINMNIRCFFFCSFSFSISLSLSDLNTSSSMIIHTIQVFSESDKVSSDANGWKWTWIKNTLTAAWMRATETEYEMKKRFTQRSHFHCVRLALAVQM